MVADCPDSYENMSRSRYANCIREEDIENALFTMPHDQEDVVTGFNKESVNTFSREAKNCAALDLACTSTVCGVQWLEDYLASLSESQRKRVKNTNSGKIFKFGDGEHLQSAGEFQIPANLAGKDIYISTDVVGSDIPLLLSKSAMKKAGMKLNLENDTAEIFGVEIALNETSSGHYCVPIDEGKIDVATVHAVDFKNLSDRERHAIILKLHRQFAHPSKKRLQCLIRDAGKREPNYQEAPDIIYDNCEICKKYRVTPARPVVALPVASCFNEKVCMVLKKCGSHWIFCT